MLIGGKVIEEITVTTKDGELVATVTDKDVIYHDEYVVTLRENHT